MKKPLGLNIHLFMPEELQALKKKYVLEKYRYKIKKVVLKFALK
jgi:hypothetical protein